VLALRAVVLLFMNIIWMVPASLEVGRKWGCVPASVEVGRYLVTYDWWFKTSILAKSDPFRVLCLPLSSQVRPL